MPRSNPSGGSCRQYWLIGLLLASGCVQSRTNLQDALARRVRPTEVAPGQSTSQDAGKGDRAARDPKVKPAAAEQLGQKVEIRSSGDRPDPLPSAIAEPPRPVDSDRPSPAPYLPSDSDQAALDAITASGKPLTLPEAID